jgi:hypothetical protein
VWRRGQACYHGFASITAMLLESGADPSICAATSFDDEPPSDVRACVRVCQGSCAGVCMRMEAWGQVFGEHERVGPKPAGPNKAALSLCA